MITTISRSIADCLRPIAWKRVILGLGMMTMAACQASSEGTSPKPSPTLPQLGTPRPAITLPPPRPSPTSQFTPPSDITLPPSTEEEINLGVPNGGVQITVYLDYQSPLSSTLMGILSDMQERHPGEFFVIIRQYPLIPIHNNATLATQAVLAAIKHNVFWEVHDHLLATHQEWSTLPQSDFTHWLEAFALELELPLLDFMEEFSSPEIANRARLSYEAALEAGIPGAPFLFMGTQPYRLPIDPINIEASFLLTQLTSLQYSTYPEMVIDPALNYFARIQTNKGELTVQLFAESAVMGVNSFVFLAQEGWLDGISIYRVVPNLLIESGDPSGTSLGNAGYLFEVEIDPKREYDAPGKVGLVNYGPGTNGSQFFITLQAIPAFTGTRTMIGEVIDGIEILDDPQARDPYLDLLSNPEITIKRIIIEERP